MSFNRKPYGKGAVPHSRSLKVPKMCATRVNSRTNDRQHISSTLSACLALQNMDNNAVLTVLQDVLYVLRLKARRPVCETLRS